MKDKSRLGCKGYPAAYDADICEKCIYGDRCYDIFLKSSQRFLMGVDLANEPANLENPIPGEENEK